VTPAEAVDAVRRIPDAFTEVCRGATGDERDGRRTWNVTSYVAHVADNLRMWSERLEGARLSGRPEVVGYDPDVLAAARHYDKFRLDGVLWSLRWASVAWCEALEAGLRDGTVLRLLTRGAQPAAEIARNNAHDAVHHLWDVRGILDRD
jgi:hypothetical protein